MLTKSDNCPVISAANPTNTLYIQEIIIGEEFYIYTNMGLG